MAGDPGTQPFAPCPPATNWAQAFHKQFFLPHAQLGEGGAFQGLFHSAQGWERGGSSSVVVAQQPLYKATPLCVKETEVPVGIALALASSLLEQGVLWRNWAVP